VPIWKKEQFVDGAVWADGESFPEEQRVGETASQRVSETGGASEGVAFGLRDGLGEESGRPSDDAHISESRYGAPGSVAKVEGGGSR